MLDAGARVARA